MKDRDGLKEPQVQANLYVGESARSLYERASEHWEGAMSGKEENHMLEHLAASHRDVQLPSFRFRVVKKCKTALERQVREAVRIEMRGNILNKKGMYNRCKLTRMVIDSEWESEVWEDAWEDKPGGEVSEDSLKATGKSKNREEVSRNKAKRARAETVDSNWGVDSSDVDRSRADFLQEEPSRRAGINQSKLQVYTGLEWMMRELLMEVAHTAVK